MESVFGDNLLGISIGRGFGALQEVNRCRVFTVLAGGPHACARVAEGQPEKGQGGRAGAAVAATVEWHVRCVGVFSFNSSNRSALPSPAFEYRVRCVCSLSRTAATTGAGLL